MIEIKVGKAMHSAKVKTKKEKDAEKPVVKDLSVIDEFTESDEEVEKFERANLKG